ncbi:MAG TPA: ubiquitin-conjugating enzyme E2 [Kofleriaceae bacterium]|nr:ubiquitin-conjugating enzyme E2 [Kofleriaceae bacterium]
MENVRLRRLKADYEALRRLAHLHPRIEIEGVFGNPPERYRLRLEVRSLRERGEAIEIATEHRLEITLPRGYPRDAPLFRMLTPVFHPNIAPHAVCIGDDWTAGEPLDLLIQRVGEILGYQSYNIKSPLNGRAAQWVAEHPGELPIDREEFFRDLSDAPAHAAELAVPACTNCGARGELTACRAGHALCADCRQFCGHCGSLVCLSCGDKACRACAAARPACANCGEAEVALACAHHHALCGDCGAPCTGCGQTMCLVCGSWPCPTCAPRAAPAAL